MSLITYRDAAFAYDNHIVVDSLNFTIDDGMYLCVVGENGSGKSTLLKGMLRLISPAKGNVEIGNGLQGNEIGYLPQQTAAQKDFPASVFEVVLSGRLNGRGIRPFYTKRDKSTAMEHMEQLGIARMKNRCYRELSGGQQQRVLLARALCATKRLLLLDEPTSGLDPVVTQELYALIQHINRSMGITLVMVSHDVHCAASCASHILHLQNRQVFFGTAAAYRQTELGQHFLGGQGA